VKRSLEIQVETVNLGRRALACLEKLAAER